MFELLIVVAALAALAPALAAQWREDRAGFIKTLKLFGLYCLYVGAGIGLTLWLAPREPASADKGLALGGFALAWIFYGALTLLRIVPRYREPPHWLMRFGVADFVLLAAIVGHMRDMDGVEAARQIRALYPAGAGPGEGRPPIVALTANAFAEDRVAYLAGGLDDYLAKPFDKEDLVALLDRWSKPLPGARKASGRGAA
jgi:CheY-like chemotaxis protein